MDFQGVNIYSLLVSIDIELKLRRLGNGQGRVIRMMMSQYGKISNRFKFAQIWTREPKEVAQHAFAVAFPSQFRERIKNIITALPRLSDDLVDFANECLKSCLGIKPAYLGS